MKLLVTIPYAEHLCSPAEDVVYQDDRYLRVLRPRTMPDLGRAYNEVMALLPEDGWACLLDHDVMFTTRVWHGQLMAAIKQEPKGAFTGVVSRGGATWQRRLGPGEKQHDIRYHRQLGEQMAQAKFDELEDMSGKEEPWGGTLMLLSKDAWQSVGGFEAGIAKVDHRMFKALRQAGRHIYLIRGLYLYHWHRAAGETHPDKEAGYGDYQAH